MNAQEIAQIQTYLRQLFGNQELRVKQGAKEDMADIALKDEFLGVIYRDNEDGDVSYNFHMSILQMDLPDSS